MAQSAKRQVGLFGLMAHREGKHHARVEVTGEDLSPSAFRAAVKQIKQQVGCQARLVHVERSARIAEFSVRKGLNAAIHMFKRILARVANTLNERVVRSMISPARHTGHTIRPTPTQKLAPEASGA